MLQALSPAGSAEANAERLPPISLNNGAGSLAPLSEQVATLILSAFAVI